ncbi:hypothetical protein KKB99_00415, partial [bacterium]|nr:hypothetical protein [bacterium]MBU1024448.1 hypothetical protein [bacterium]
MNPTIPVSDDYDSGFLINKINEGETNHQISGSWTVEFDIETLSCEVRALRDTSAHINLSGFLPAPGIHVNSYDPVNQIIDVDVTINNSTPYTGYDLRLIIFTDGVGHKLLNFDDWTGLFDKPGGLPINPFKTFAKSETNRVFTGMTQHTENLLIRLPGGNPSVSFLVEASYPGNCEEPYEIDSFTQEVLKDQSGSSTGVSVTVRDWQNNTNSVDLYCPQITGQTLVPFAQSDPELWEMSLVNNTGAIAGAYT